MICRPRVTSAFAGFVALACVLTGVSEPLAAQDSRPSAPIPILLELTLVDRTSMVASNPQHGEEMPAETAFVLANASVELKSFTPDADEVTTRGTTDSRGVIVLDLGLRTPGSPYTVTATGADGERYLSKEQAMSSANGSLHLYRASDDHSDLEQAVMKIATLAAGEDALADTVRVQVRQMIRFQNGGLEVFDGPPDALGIGFIFPVPVGAVVRELSVTRDISVPGEGVLDLEPREVGHWGYGVPIPKPVFPLEAKLLIGVYEFELKKGDVFDIGFESVVTTREVQISLEQNVFTHDAQVAKKWDVDPLPAMGSQPMPDVGRTVDMFGVRSVIAAHTQFRVPVRFGPPPISMMTIWMTLLIVACFALPVVVGLSIAKSRSGGAGAPSREAKLRALHAEGELSEADLARELARLGAAQATAAPAPVRTLPKDVLDRLSAISVRDDETPEAVAKDVRALASILRDHFQGDSLHGDSFQGDSR